MGVIVFARGELVELVRIGFPTHAAELEEDFACFAIDAVLRTELTAAFAFFEWQSKSDLVGLGLGWTHEVGLSRGLASGAR